MLAAGMFIGVAQGQERQEDLVVPAEILRDDGGAACAIVQDRAVMLHHAARGAAGTRGVDDAGEIAAGEGRARRRGLGRGRVRGDQRVPVVEIDRGGDAHVLEPDHDLRLVRAQDGGEQRFRQLCGRDDDRAGARILDDVEVIAFGVGDIGRHRHAARRHDREVAEAPFGAILADQHHPVAAFEPDRGEGRGEARHLSRGVGPAGRHPGAALLGPEERRVAPLRGAREEHGDEVGEGFELAGHGLSWGALANCVPSRGRSVFGAV